MFRSKIVLPALALAALGGCTDGDGYTGVSLGYGVSSYGGGYYDDGYYDDGYYGGYRGGYYGRGYAPAYYGWYGDYYYPGSGVYVYDRHRRPHRWSDPQRSYWQRRGRSRHTHGELRDNWQGFARDRRHDGRSYRHERHAGNPSFGSGAVTPPQFRQEPYQVGREHTHEDRQDRRVLRRENSDERPE